LGRPFKGRRIQQLKREELEEIFDNAFLDREQAEVVSLTESYLLDVDRGEALRNSREDRFSGIILRRFEPGARHSA